MTLARAQVRAHGQYEATSLQTMPMHGAPAQLGPQKIFLPKNVILKTKALKGTKMAQKNRLLGFLTLILIIFILDA